MKPNNPQINSQYLNNLSGLCLLSAVVSLRYSFGIGKQLSHYVEMSEIASEFNCGCKPSWLVWAGQYHVISLCLQAPLHMRLVPAQLEHLLPAVVQLIAV